jgi:phosphatidate cytidylyltransferase
MKLRIASAAVAVPLLYLFVYLGTGAIGGLVIAAGLVAGYEIVRMATRPDAPSGAFVALTPAFAAGAGLAIAYDQVGWWALGAGLAAGFLPAAMLQAMRGQRDSASLWRLLAAAFLGSLLAHGPALRALDESGWWLLTALLTTFAVDSAAYFVGTSLGRHRLAPAISPAKSWEGLFGGLAGGIGAAIALAYLFDLGVSAGQAAGIGAAVAAAAVAGDLAESALKRSAGVKDAGRIIPGHGGVLDRLDSLAPNLAVVYWLAVWLTV